MDIAKHKRVRKAKNNKVLRILIMSLACLLVEVGFYFFLLPQALVTGGVMGISIIFEQLQLPAWITPSIIRYGLNILFLIIGLIFLGKDFFFKTVYLSLLAPTFVFILDNVCHVPYDLITSRIAESPLLISAVMSGILVGVGLGLVLRYGGSTGGVDIPQKIISKYTKISFAKAMYMIDGVIILAAFVIYITQNNLDNLFLAVLSMIISGIIIDRLSISGRSGYTYFIISDHYDEIKSDVFSKIERGATIINAQGAYTNAPKNMLVCNILKREKIAMDELINEIDPKAFVFIVESKEIFGYGFSKNQEPFIDKIIDEIHDKRKKDVKHIEVENDEEDHQNNQEK